MWLRANFGWALVLAFAATTADAQDPALTQELARAESHYADFVDALGAVGLIDSGFATTFDGKDRSEWQRIHNTHRAQARAALTNINSSPLGAADRRALTIMTAALNADATSLAPTSKCSSANTAEGVDRRSALYACFEEHGNRVSFQGRTLTRVAALDALATLDDARERRMLFMAFQPLWRAINHDNQADSPYRKMLVEFSASKDNVHFTQAAATLGLSSAEVKRWLVDVLSTWRHVVKPPRMEPWDYRYIYGAAERQLALDLPAPKMQVVATDYFQNLGAEPATWNALYDLEPRVGKAPLAYADFVRRGRWVDGRWRPTLGRISGSYSHGRLGMLTELVHEMTHVAHMMALQTRPAFMDLGDALFYEAVADIPSWSLYEREWQLEYLNRAADRRASLLGLFSNIMLDVAWALFDITMLEQPTADPNAVWTDITHRYLNIAPHPELSWWCLRVQLVDSPGYMVNYGLGSVVTADLRAQLAQNIGRFDGANPRWFAHLSNELLRQGSEHETRLALNRYFGRPVSPAALIEQLRRLSL